VVAENTIGQLPSVKIKSAAQKVERPPPFDMIGKGSREGSGRPVGLNTAKRSS
jgi:hypothetical protein